MKNALRIQMLGIMILAATALLQAQALPAGQDVAKPAIVNYVEFSPGIGTGGQPTEEGLKELAAKGYKSIINIRSASEQFDVAGEERLALQLGMRYYMIPFAAKETSEEQALAFNALMSALKDTKVFVHCGSGNRVGSLMMIHLVLDEGMPGDKAEQEAKKIGLRSAELLDFAKRVIASHKKF
jgi:uncharacterized protein (TIGR01244 family)